MRWLKLASQALLHRLQPVLCMLQQMSRPRGIVIVAVAAPLVAAVLCALFTRPAQNGLPARQLLWLAIAIVLLLLSAAIAIGHLSYELSQTSRLSRVQKWSASAALLIALASITAYNEFDGLLRGLHPRGDAAFGLAIVTNVFTSPERRPDQLTAAIDTWSRFVRPRASGAQSDACVLPGSANANPETGEQINIPFPQDCNAPITVLAWQLGLDTALLVPAYGMLITLLILCSREALYEQQAELETTAGTGITADFRLLGLWAAGCIVVAVIADWVENIISLWLITGLWNTTNGGGSNAGQVCTLSAGWCASPVRFLYGATLFKASGFVLSVIYLLLVALLLACHGGAFATRWTMMKGAIRSLLAVRVPILIVALLGAGLLIHEQVPDVIRRWADTPYVGGRGVLMTIALSLVLWCISRWMLDLAATDAPTGSALWTWVFVTLAVIVTLFIGWPDWTPNWWKLAIPLGMALVIAVLSGPLVGKFTQSQPFAIRPLHERNSAVGCCLLQLDADLWSIARNRLAEITGRQPEHLSVHDITPYWQEVYTANRNKIAADDPHRLAQEKTELTLPRVPPPSGFPGWGGGTLPALLASATITILGLAILRSSVGAALYYHMRNLEWWPLLRLVGFGTLLVLLAGLLAWVLHKLDTRPIPKERKKRRVRLVEHHWFPAGMLLGCIVGWWLIEFYLAGSDSIYRIAPTFGALGLLSAALLLLTLTGCSVIAVADRLPKAPAPVFRALGLHRTPVLSLVTIWFVLASILPPEEPLHDIRKNPSHDKPMRGESLEAVFNTWLEQNCLVGPTPVSSADSKPTVPLILVASSGGGIRAAVWTSYVLSQTLGEGRTSCTVSPNRYDPGSVSRSNWLFAASGVSGGSLGLATYVARLTEPTLPPAPAFVPPDTPCVETQHWVCERLGSDNLAPSLGWLLFAETPWSLLRFNADRDRAAVLEATWEGAWPTRALSQNLFDLRSQREQQPPVPLLVFNGTSVESGCRFNASVLKANGRERSDPAARCLEPLEQHEDVRGIAPTPTTADQTRKPPPTVLAATVDLVDFLCSTRDPISLAKAVLLSARFPLISPSGHITQCGSRSEGAKPETFVVDGGYLENSAAATAVELWLALQPMIDEHNQNPEARAYIVPFFMQIDNGYGEPVGPGRVPAEPQFVVPFTTLGATGGGRQAMARQTAESLFSMPFIINGPQLTEELQQTEKPQQTKTVMCPRYVRFALQAHPGPQAPLGWTLSSESFKDLKRQFEEDAGQKPLQQMATWFEGLLSPTCSG